MSKLSLHTRSFHPLENFGAGGLGFEGDNRGFTTDLGVTSRIRNLVEINLRTATVDALTTISDPSSNHFLDWHQDYEDEDLQPTESLRHQIDPYSEDGDQHLRLTLAYRGQNFAMPDIDDADRRQFYKDWIPDLDVTLSLHLTIDRANKKMVFAARMVGDGFPNAESFLLDGAPEGEPLFMVVHRRIGSATGQLAGNRRIAMASGSAKVDYESDKFGTALQTYWAQDYATHLGGPIDLTSEFGRKPQTRTDWNLMHTAHDAKGGRVRRWWLDNDVVWVRGRPGSSMP